MKENQTSMERILMEQKGVVNYSREPQFEVKPGIFIPVFIDIKSTQSNHEIRRLITNRLASKIGTEYDHICGLESGGNYYASAVGDSLGKPIVYFRKDNKAYGDRRRLVGIDPNPGDTIAIIDDVLATGAAITEAIAYFSQIGCKSDAYVIFNYRTDGEFEEILKRKILSLANFPDLFKLAEDIGYWLPEDIEYIKREILSYR